MNHMGPFASELKKQGHRAAIVLPELDPTFKFFPYAEVPAFSYDDFLKNPNRFEGEPPQIVHAWTPREVVRRFCDTLREEVETRCIIHLEDDENAIRNEFPATDGGVLSRTDPLHGSWFLESADGFTIIIESLADCVPQGKPVHHLYPGFDQHAASKNPEPAFTRATFGIPEDFKLVVYPGGASGPNTKDLIDLFKAVHLLNEHGTPCLLLKTGFPDPRIRESIPHGAENWIRDVGYLPRDGLWRLIELADVVVQPGRMNDYNQKRLPSKLPDFLCLGKPVITSKANLGQKLEEGKQALILTTSKPKEIASRCQDLFSHPALAKRIAEGGRELGQALFDLTKNTSGLIHYYGKILKSPPNRLSLASGNQIEKAITSLEQELALIAAPSREALRIRTYLRAVRKTEKKKENQKKSKPPVQVELQVFFPNHPEKLELGSIRRWYARGRHQKCLLPFSPPQDLDWIRIDPGQYPGTYLLKSWAFLDAGENSVFEWTPESKLEVTCQLNGATAGPIGPGGQEIWSLTHDPQMLFAPLPAFDTDKIRWFRIEFAANEIESPLTTTLKLRRTDPTQLEYRIRARNQNIDTLLKTLERRRSPVLRFIDRWQKKIKG